MPLIARHPALLRKIGLEWRRVAGIPQMNVLGIALIVIGAALVCCALVFRRGTSSDEEARADTALSNIRPRLDQIGDRQLP